MPLSQAAIKKEEDYLGAITWKSLIWGPLSRGNFRGDNCLGVIISGQLFCDIFTYINYSAAIIVPGRQLFGGAIIREAIILGGNCPGTNYLGVNSLRGNYPGRQFSRGKLSGGVDFPRGNYPVPMSNLPLTERVLPVTTFE